MARSAGPSALTLAGAFMGTPRNSSFWIVVAIVTLMAIIIGCGGSGSSSGGGSSAPTGNAAVRSSAVAGYQSMGAGVALPFAALQATAPAGSVIETAARIFRQTGISYVPQLGLYTSGFVTNSKGGTFTYYTDSAGQNAAGTMTVTSSTGSFNYTSYPATITITISVTAGNMPCHGSCSLVYSGSSGANTLVGSLTLTKNSEVLAINLKLDASGNATGSLTVTEDSTTIQGTNVSGPLSGDLAFKFTLLPQGYKGTGSINVLGGTMALNFTQPSGASCSVDSSGDLVVTYQGGSTQTITNPFSAGLLSGNGSTGSTSSSSTASTSTATTSTATTSTSTTSGVTVPYTLTTVAGTTPSIIDVAPGGPMVGTSNKVPTYWASPSAQPQVITLDATLVGIVAEGVNSSGQIVGVGYDSSNNTVPLYWAAYNQKPVHMKMPAPITYQTSANAYIQSGGEIAFTFQYQGQSYVYKSYTDTSPYLVQGGTLSGLSDGAAAIGMSPNGALVYWKQLSSTATPVSVPEANTPSVKTAVMGADGTIVVSDFGANTVTVVPGPSYTQQIALPQPKGAVNAVNVGPTGHVLGTDMDDQTSLDNTGLIWKADTAQPIELRSSATPNVLYANFETTTGVLIVTAGVGTNGGTYTSCYMTPK